MKENIFYQIKNKISIFINRELLHSTFIPEILPHRDKEIREIASIIQPIFQKQTPSNIIIYGKPGTGKTVTVKNVGSQINDFYKNVRYIHINCQIINTQYRVLQNIIEEVSSTKKIPFTGLPTDKLYKEIIKILGKQNVDIIVALDEVDRLKDDSIIYTLTRINTDLKESKISLICIANNLRYTDFLDPRIKSSLSQETIVFKPYDAKQLEDILYQRAKIAIKKDVIDDGVISLCAALAAQEHGDARKALNLLRISATIAERNNDEKITRTHVIIAHNKNENNRIKEIVENLPYQMKILINAIIKLEKTQNKQNEQIKITTGEIYHMYTQLCRQEKYQILSQRRITDFITELDSMGIINARKISKGRKGNTREIKTSIKSNLLNSIIKNDCSKEIKYLKQTSII